LNRSVTAAGKTAIGARIRGVVIAVIAGFITFYPYLEIAPYNTVTANRLNAGIGAPISIVDIPIIASLTGIDRAVTASGFGLWLDDFIAAGAHRSYSKH
jgi:hypothetical protein